MGFEFLARRGRHMPEAQLEGGPEKGRTNHITLALEISCPVNNTKDRSTRNMKGHDNNLFGKRWNTPFSLFSLRIFINWFFPVLFL